jgi:hypothetical protein
VAEAVASETVSGSGKPVIVLCVPDPWRSGFPIVSAERNLVERVRQVGNGGFDDEAEGEGLHIVKAAPAAELTRALAEFNAQNVKWLKVLRADLRIKILRFSDELIRTFGKLSKEVLADTAAKDPLTRKVYDSYMAFLAGSMDWGELSETGYRNTRRLALA